MAKPTKEEIIKTTVRIPKALWNRVRIRAIEESSSAESLVIAALIQYLKGDRQ